MAKLLANNNKLAKTDVAELSEEETKKYLTPFAFKMDKSLFGLPLASPAKRGIALLIDFSLIAVLSGTSGDILTLTIAITLYYLGNKKRAQRRGKIKGHKRRAIMRFIAGLMLFVTILDTLPDLLDSFDDVEDRAEVSITEESISFTQSIALTATALAVMKTISASDCQSFSCWQTQLDSAAIQMANISYEGDIKVTKTQLGDIFNDISKEVELPFNEQQRLTASMLTSYDKEFSRLAGNNVLEQSKSTVIASAENNLQNKEEKSNRPVYSIIEWVKGIIEDLGLGFGWATFYFTAFISIGKGQTIGKKLLGIKVLQLDGTPLSLWDSFGRYGGYGAGLATGLLGFIQIYWDPNRQAIHDQISATVVIDVNKMRLSQKVLKNNE